MSSLEELRNYEEQIRVIEARLAEEFSEELQETLNDLQELLGTLSLSTDDQEQQDSVVDDEKETNFDDLIGSRVMASYPGASQVQKFHVAIILDIELSDDGKIQARVLFSMPLTPAMKPCSFFLKDNCRFENNCKFSHGHLVPIEELEEYKAPDFAQLKEDCLVLTVIENGLWDIGRIVAMDKEESAVKLLKSGKEISSQTSALIPLGDISDSAVEEPSRLPNTSWTELKGERLGDLSVGELGNWTGGGFGLKMLQKMGYKLGEGLGKNSDGIVHAVQAKIYPKGKGLDSFEGVPASKKQKKPKKNRKVLPGKVVVEEENEIFSFINRRLCGTTRNEAKSEIEDRKQMVASTESSLGTQNLTIEMELKKMRSNEKKLIEGIARNSKSDPKTVAKLQQRLEALRKDISRLERQHGNIRSEQSNRRQKKRDIF